MSMMRRLICILTICVSLAACANNTSRRDLQTEHAQASTQIADLRLTATVQSARIQTTLDYSGTQVAGGATLSAFIQATLNSEGVPLESLQQFQEQFISRRSLVTPSPLATGISSAAPATPIGAPDANASPTVPGVTPLAMLITPTQAPTIVREDPNAPVLESPVTSFGVGNDDCAVNASTTFGTETSEIYLVVTAVNTPANTSFGSRWLREGDVLTEVDFSLNFEIERACIWFFVDQTDFVFTAGTYTVELILNGAPTGQIITFNIQ